MGLCKHEGFDQGNVGIGKTSPVIIWTGIVKSQDQGGVSTGKLMVS